MPPDALKRTRLVDRRVLAEGTTHEAEETRAIGELRSSRLETVERLAKAIEFHDYSTGEHVTRMAGIAAFLGSRLEKASCCASPRPLPSPTTNATTALDTPSAWPERRFL